MSASHEDLRQAGRALFRDGLVAREVVRPLVIFAANLAFYLGLQVFIAVTPSAVAKAGLGFLAGIATSTLFIIGHDCAHGSFTRSTSLNRILGSIAMLPGLHPYSLWERGHNQVHHRFTLQMDRDNAFPPLSPRAYAALSPWRRAYYRFLRSAAGQLTYYLVEIWLPTMVLPIKKEIGPFKKIYAADLALLAGFIVILISAATIATAHYHQEAIGGILLSKVALYHLVLPFLIWMILISFLTVVQHTHPQARWRMASGSPSTTRDQADGTIHVVFPEWLDLVFHRVMHHHAHHLQPAIPVYHLKFAQSHLAGAAASEGTPFITARWSFRHHFDVAARCKLFDVENDCWRDFTGRVTGQPPIQGAL